MTNLHQNYNKKECVYVSFAYPLRAQLVMSFRNANVAWQRRFSYWVLLSWANRASITGETLAPVFSTAGPPDKP